MRSRRWSNRVQPLALIACTLIGAHACAALAAESQLPAAARILDPDIYFYGWPYPSVSPDGNWVGYVSNGFVCVCNITKPAPRRIQEVPNSYTWPHLAVRDTDISKTSTFESLSKGLSHDQYNNLHAQISRTVYGLNWFHDSSGFVFGIREYDAQKKLATYDAYYTSVAGEIANLAHISPDRRVRSIAAGYLTPNRQFLVSPGLSASSDRYRPLIWNVKENKPRATPFLYLKPSATAGRWIGIEKDTRQLVITDESFEVVQRFDEFLPARTFGFQLDWSPDEHFIVWRNQVGFDHFSNWEGFWMDLASGEKRSLEGLFMSETIDFTGRGGDFVRFGADGTRSKQWSGDLITGAHLTLIPSTKEQPRDIWRIQVDQNKRQLSEPTFSAGNAHLQTSPDGNLFAIALPRSSAEKPGAVWHLINRDGKKWRFPGRDNGQYISPYEVAGFADSGKKIIAYDSTQLFTLPVSAIMVAENEAK